MPSDNTTVTTVPGVFLEKLRELSPQSDEIMSSVPNKIVTIPPKPTENSSIWDDDSMDTAVVTMPMPSSKLDSDLPNLDLQDSYIPEPEYEELDLVQNEIKDFFKPENQDVDEETEVITKLTNYKDLKRQHDFVKVQDDICPRFLRAAAAKTNGDTDKKEIKKPEKKRNRRRMARETHGYN